MNKVGSLLTILLCCVLSLYFNRYSVHLWNKNNESAHDEADFDAVAFEAYQAIKEEGNRLSSNRTRQSSRFNLSEWERGTGGLTDRDRLLLYEIYSNATSLFEYGLGESTFLANHVGVPRYAGIDSDIVWVNMARANVSDHFRFYFADIGQTGAWGYPTKRLAKAEWQYQVAPLESEPLPFDVYMVDGRWRVACMLLSFLHASARGGRGTIVLLHDCWQPGISPEDAPGHRKRAIYRQADGILQLWKHSGDYLCAYKRQPNTTDVMLRDMYRQFRSNVQ